MIIGFTVYVDASAADGNRNCSLRILSPFATLFNNNNTFLKRLLFFDRMLLKVFKKWPVQKSPLCGTYIQLHFKVLFCYNLKMLNYTTMLTNILIFYDNFFVLSKLPRLKKFVIERLCNQMKTLWQTHFNYIIDIK